MNQWYNCTLFTRYGFLFYRKAAFLSSIPTAEPRLVIFLTFPWIFPDNGNLLIRFTTALTLSNVFLLVLLLWCMKISPSLSLTASLRRTYCSRHAVENQLGKNEKSHLYMETVKLLNHRWVCITYLFKSLWQKLVCDLCEHRVTNSGFTSNMGWQT